jgi:hypothetical protein
MQSHSGFISYCARLLILVTLMRFLISGLGLNIALCGLLLPNLAMAAPTSPVAILPAPSQQLELTPTSIEEGTVIQGNGVEFTVPNGFEGGAPSDTQTKTLIQETVKMFPSMGSFVEMLERDPGAFRAIAMNTSESNANPSIVLITRLPVPADISLTYLQETMAKMMPAMLPTGFKLTDSRVVNIGDRQIVKLAISGNIQGAKFKESIALLKQGDEIFQITYVFDDKNARQARPVFDRMVRTFKADATVATGRSPY